MHIEYTSLDRVEEYWAAVDTVAKERKYLLFTQAPPIESTHEFVKEIIENKWSQFYAIDNGKLVGWCDVIPYPYEGCQHVAHLGMGLLPSHRGKGLGTLLINEVTKDAFSKGIERIELEVFSTNEGAIALYEKVGFQVEGRKVAARKIDGVTSDFILMALRKS